ncbi:hypothetical protein Taro_028156 [Colocasia esculenta]|uniref:WAT1-related protein n=1 Tax=Colocasia esculenta TaxID=4460 RepID=A0A843VK84_COLES|nr:hypothetical protein [Colocasia esculenta]
MGYTRACAPYVFMIVVQLAYGVSNILCKLALENGLSYLVFIVYRHLIAVFIFAPLAYIFERKQGLQLTRPILAKIFFLSLMGTTVHQNVYYAGLEYTFPTVACALSSVIPALTFVLAVLLRMEKLLGTLVCVGGVLLFTFCKGHLFKGIVSRPMIVMKGKGAGHGVVGHAEESWIKGAGLILASYVAYSAWLILQALVCEVYPAKLSMNTLICIFASMQSSVLALIFERNPTSWRLEWNIQLLTIGTAISGLVYYLQTWCINEKGPVFAAMFLPLQLVIVAIFSAFIFAERLHLGSLVGALLIVLGLYCVLWGKRNNNNENKKDESLHEEAAVHNPTSSNQMIGTTRFKLIIETEKILLY